jgi:TolB protein
MDHAINVTGLDGTDAHPISSADGIDVGASWSPDGTMIAFTRFTADDHRELWITATDGSGARKLITSPTFDNPNTGYDFTPQWSPDSTRLAVTTANHGHAQIEVVTVADATAKVVTPPTTKKKAIGSICATWSPDGTTLAFLDDRTGGAFDLYTVAANGSRLTQITKDPTEEFSPSWRPS